MRIGGGTQHEGSDGKPMRATCTWQHDGARAHGNMRVQARGNMWGHARGNHERAFENEG